MELKERFLDEFGVEEEEEVEVGGVIVGGGDEVQLVSQVWFG